VDPKSADYLKFLVPTPGCTSNCGVNTADPTFAGGKQCNLNYAQIFLIDWGLLKE